MYQFSSCLLIFINAIIISSSIQSVTSKLISCPCRFTIQAHHDAPSFEVISTPSAVNKNKVKNSTYPVTTLLTNKTSTKYRYYTSYINHPGAFNVSIRPTSKNYSVHPSSFSIVNREPGSESRCHVLLPQHPPLRFETLSAKQTHTHRHEKNMLQPKSRIVGGLEAGRDVAKYLALIKAEHAWATACTGTLVGPSTVITAAHCRISTNSLVYLGATDKDTNLGTEFRVLEVTKHPAFPVYQNRYHQLRTPSVDIAYITLNGTAPSDSKFMKININPSIPQNDSIVRAAGYGKTTHRGPVPQSLHQVDLEVLSSPECARKYKHDAKEIIDPDRVFCITKVANINCSPCQADSGGPIWQYDENDDPVLIGIISRGRNCSTMQLPALASRTSSNYLFLPKDRELTWSNATVALKLKRNKDNGMTVTTAPSPSYTPLPTQFNISDNNTSTPLLAIIIGSIAGVLGVCALVAIAMVLARR